LFDTDPATAFPSVCARSAGKDATEDFEEIGHSNAAKEMLAKYLVGDLKVRLPPCEAGD
jgi:cytochrome b involved in lipid metabolism